MFRRLNLIRVNLDFACVAVGCYGVDSDWYISLTGLCLSLVLLVA